MRQQEARKYLRTHEAKKSPPPTPSAPSATGQTDEASAHAKKETSADLATSDKEDSSTISSEKSEMSLTEAIADIKEDQVNANNVSIKTKKANPQPKLRGK